MGNLARAIYATTCIDFSKAKQIQFPTIALAQQYLEQRVNTSPNTYEKFRPYCQRKGIEPFASKALQKRQHTIPRANNGKRQHSAPRPQHWNITSLIWFAPWRHYIHHQTACSIILLSSWDVFSYAMLNAKPLVRHISVNSCFSNHVLRVSSDCALRSQNVWLSVFSKHVACSNMTNTDRNGSCILLICTASSISRCGRDWGRRGSRRQGMFVF